MTQTSSLTCILLAAGKGTRMHSALPKVLHSLCGQSLLERSIRAVAPLAPREVVVVIGAGRERVEQEIERIRTIPACAALTIRSVVQAEQRGTGDAAAVGLAAATAASERIAILPGDVPLLSTAELHLLLQGAALPDLRVLSCVHPEPYGFGRIVRDDSGAVQGIVEERDASEEQRRIQEINSSIYLVERALLQDLLATLDSNNAQGELYLTDIVSAAVARGCSVDAVTAGDYLKLSGANTRVELSALERVRRRELVESFQLAGVSFEDPYSVYIDESVEIGSDTWIGANTRLLGDTRIGPEVVIEGDSRLENAVIHQQVHLKLCCYINEAEVAARCVVGPFVQLRPGARLDEDVKLGNFVEVKNAHFGAAAKANHLAYIGDAEVGAGSNIGAGTIFCNYDGVKKHRSTLEENVFVGSNAVLVSPVHIGAGAYIAAGSTITKDVSGGALGIARAKQTTIEGWVARKRTGKTKS